MLAFCYLPVSRTTIELTKGDNLFYLYVYVEYRDSVNLQMRKVWQTLSVAIIINHMEQFRLL